MLEYGKISVRCRSWSFGTGSGEKGNRCESCTNSSPYLGSRSLLDHWETGKMADAKIYEPGDLPDRCTEIIMVSDHE
jgi:hypothetical protein